LTRAVTEKVTLNADGSMSLLTEGSTQKITSVVHHAGVSKVERWQFELP
jgi:hypothetical protein